MADQGGSERPDRLKNSKVGCGTMEAERRGGVAVGGGAAGEGNSGDGDGCESAIDDVELCCDQSKTLHLPEL